MNNEKALNKKIWTLVIGIAIIATVMNATVSFAIRFLFSDFLDNDVIHIVGFAVISVPIIYLYISHELKKNDISVIDLRNSELKKEIGESEERYRMLVENSPAGIITCDTNGNITTVNLAIAKMLGSPSVEATKQINVFTFPPLIESGITESLKKCLKTGEMIKGEFAYTSKWGIDIYLRAHFAPIRDFSGKITGLQGIVEDFTEYKKAQDQLRLYYHVIEHIPVAVNISNENGEIEYINPKYTELTGYTPDEVVGKNTSHLYEKGSASESYFKELMATIKAGKIWKREFHNVKKNGEQYWENISASPVFDENGRIYHLIAIKEDITERVKETMKARFLAYHDGLTGLANRSLFYDRLIMALANAKRNQHNMAVMYLDLDGFKDTLCVRIVVR